MSRLLEKYKTKILPQLKTTLGRDNVHSIPRITKVVISMGLGKALGDRKRIEEAVDHLRTIAGQKPQITKSRVAVSGFRLREGVDVGCKVTLRGIRMYDFIDRLITLALPRVRDFRGVRSTGFDGNGNFSMKQVAVHLGVSERTVMRHIKSKDMGCLKIGKRVVIPAADLRAFKNKCRDI